VYSNVNGLVLESTKSTNHSIVQDQCINNDEKDEKNDERKDEKSKEKENDKDIKDVKGNESASGTVQENGQENCQENGQEGKVSDELKVSDESNEDSDEPNDFTGPKLFSHVTENFGDLIGREKIKSHFKTKLIDQIKNKLTPQELELMSDLGLNRYGNIIILHGVKNNGKSHIVKCVAGELDAELCTITCTSDVTEEKIKNISNYILEHIEKSIQTEPNHNYVVSIRNVEFISSNSVIRKQLIKFIKQISDKKLPVNLIMTENTSDEGDGQTSTSKVADGYLEKGLSVSRLEVPLITYKEFSQIAKKFLYDHSVICKLKSSDDIGYEQKNIDNFNMLFYSMITHSSGSILKLFKDIRFEAYRKWSNTKKPITLKQLSDIVDELQMSDSEMMGYINRMSKQDIKRTAFHEIGHTIVAKQLMKDMDLVKVSIVPKSQFLGVNCFTKNFNKLHQTYEQLKGCIATFLGGAAIEELMFNEVSAGASNDIFKANELARVMVSDLGMGKNLKMINFFNMNDKEAKTLSNKEAREIVNECYKMAKDTISSNKELIEKLVDKLIKEETMMSYEVDSVIKEFKASKQSKKA